MVTDGENREAIAFSCFCVARNVSCGAAMLPSELLREIGEGESLSEIIEQPTRRNSEAPVAPLRSSISMTEHTSRWQSLMSLPSWSRSRVWKSSPKPACTRSSFLFRQNAKLSFRSSNSWRICTVCLHESATATTADDPLSPRLAVTAGR